MRIPGIARFLVRSGNEILCAPEGATPPHLIAIFLIGTVFAILLHQRGGVVLHASAVGVGDRAVLFCGPSGAGKSTMAAALEQRGYPLLNDDICLLGTDATGATIVYSDGRGPNLWADAIGHLDLAARQGQAVRADFGKYYVEPREATTRPLVLGAIHVLRSAHLSRDEGLETPSLVDAIMLIRHSAYHPRLVAALKQKQHCFLSAANLCAKAEVSVLSRPRDLAGMSARIDLLEEHWRRTGLGGFRP
jgi:hypothetical protein